jgi:hypothetical protein
MIEAVVDWAVEDISCVFQKNSFYGLFCSFNLVIKA